MTVTPDTQAIRDAADQADTIDWDDDVHSSAELLEVLVPAARTAADLLDAIGDPRLVESMYVQANCGEEPAGLLRFLRRIAVAAAAARGEQ